MSTKQLKPNTALPVAPEDDEAYYASFEPVVSVSLDHVEKDVICTHCGYWKSEHDWNICKKPNYST